MLSTFTTTSELYQQASMALSSSEQEIGNEQIIKTGIKLEESEQQKEGKTTVPKRKRGRSCRISAFSVCPKTKDADFVEEMKGGTSNAKENAERSASTGDGSAPVATARTSGSSDSTPTDCLDMMRLSDVCRLRIRRTPRKQVRKQRKLSTGSAMFNLNEPHESQTEDDSFIRAIQVFDDNSDDDRPISAGCEGTHFLPTNDSNRCSAGSSGQYNEIVKTIKTEYNIDEPLQSDLTIAVPVKEQDLPFVKSSILWQTVENMEVYKRLPQNPHFRPLYDCKEDFREGFAIGKLVNFAKLVESISEACFYSPKSVFAGNLEYLTEFEEFGFEVEPIREKLNTMISIKGKFERAQYTCRDIESQIMERNLEKSTINEELEEADKKIRELLFERKKKEEEIMSLQTHIGAIKHTLEAAQKEFEKVANSIF
ncbi:unnamed protein product [Amaranthus hypochondriacus]